VLAGAGLALNTGPAVGLAVSAIPLRRAGLASGVVNLARLVGITVGVAVLGSAMAAIGAQAAMLIGGVIQLIGAVVALRWGQNEAVASTTKEVCHA
jgi:predicted MFS family arabinose efflux permease